MGVPAVQGTEPCQTVPATAEDQVSDPGGFVNAFAHSGDLGDIIASLPAVRALGGGRFVITPNDPSSGATRESMQGARFDAIKPLLAAQPYIESVEWMDSFDDPTHDFRTFRNDPIRGESLAHWQARHIGAEISTAPWLTVPISHRAKSRVVIARSARYHSRWRIWDTLFKAYPNPIFVGLREEYLHLSSTTQVKFEHAATTDLLELASIIAGCALFAGNQSCPWWIAFALGVPTIQEVFPLEPNSRIERAGATYFDEPPFEL